MDEQELRVEAVRRRLSGESPTQIAAALGRTDRWVRKWVARYGEKTPADRSWSQSRSRAPHSSPRRTAQLVREQVIAARRRLVADPRGQYGALAIAWELRRLGVDPVPHAWTINRIVAEAGLARPRRRPEAYRSKNVPYPRPAVGPNELQQADLVGPRHLEGALGFHTINLVDVGTHAVGSEILPELRTPLIAQALVRIWGRVGLPRRLQLDNHSNLRGAIPPAASVFGPVVATCLDLGVVPRFIPLREPWRNGVVEHFNDVWDKAFFRSTRFAGIDQLTEENAHFEAFHNAQHRYSAHRGATPDEMRTDLELTVPVGRYRPPGTLPRRGRIEVVRFVRSNRRLDLFGHRLVLDEQHAHRYVTAIIRIRPQTVVVITTDGEIAHEGHFTVSRELR